MRLLLLSFLLCSMSGCRHPAAAPQGQSPSAISNTRDAADARSPTNRKEVVEFAFGHEVRDTFRWIENVKEPSVEQWLQSKEETTQATISRIPAVDGLRNRILELLTETDTVDQVKVAGDAVFYLRRNGGARAATIRMRRIGAPERLLYELPPNIGAASIGHLSPSHDGRFLAFAIDIGGTEDNLVQVFDVEKNVLTPDRIEHTPYPAVSWARTAPRSPHRFYYTRFPRYADPDPAMRHRDACIAAHDLGTPAEKDPIVVGQPDDGVELAIGDVPLAYTAPNSAYEVSILVHGTSNEYTLYSRRIATGIRPSPWRRVVSRSDAVSVFTLLGSNLFVQTDRDPARTRIARIRLDDHESSFEACADVTLGARVTAISASRDAIFIAEEGSQGSALYRMRPETCSVGSVSLPFEGTVTDVVSETNSPFALFQVNGWSQSARWLSVTGNAAAAPAFPDQETRAVPEQVVDHLEAVSRDGTHVPLTLLSRKSTPKDGSAPVLLVGYGSYGTSIRPRYNPNRVAWLEAGGVLAFAHVRGGGELGRKWHLDGMREHKTNSIDDFIACGDLLVSSGRARRERLAAAGDSAGGLLVGTAMTRRPDLFRAVYISNGMVNILRLMKIAIGQGNIEEFGSPETETGLLNLLSLDVYQQTRDGVAYPAVLLAAGANDPRVPYWQSAKLAARLEEASSSGRPVLLHINQGSGHIGGTSEQFAESMALEYAFLLWQLGAPTAASSTVGHRSAP